MFFEEHLNDTIDDEHVAPPAFVGETEGIATSQGSDGVVPPASSSMLPSSAGNSQKLFNTSAGRPSSSPSLLWTAPSRDEANGQSQSPAVVVQLLMEATSNEVFSPEILPYPSSTINAVVTLLDRKQHQIRETAAQEKLDASTPTAPQQSLLLPFRASDIMAVELQRLQFFFTELLRSRLQKISKLAALLYYEGLRENESSRGAGVLLPEVQVPQRHHLSPNERVVADRLAIAAQQAVLRSGLQMAPPPLQHLVPHPPAAEGPEILPEPLLDRYVFGVALEDLGVVNLGAGYQDASRAIQAGELFLSPYRNFRAFVMAGQVRLV